MPSATAAVSPLPAPRRPPVSDADLLGACLSAGEPGTDSHTLASRAYRRSVLEWRRRDVEWRQAEAEGVVWHLLADVAGAAWMSVLMRRGLGGGRD